MALSDFMKEWALNPQWDKAERVHDWRNHVGAQTKRLWDTFTAEQKFAIVEDADYRAGDEHWD